MTYRPYEHRRGRWTLQGDAGTWQRPRVSSYLWDDYVAVVLEWGDSNGNSPVALTLDLTGTRAGRWLLAAADRCRR